MKKTIGKFLMLTALAGTISSGFAMKKESNDEILKGPYNKTIIKSIIESNLQGLGVNVECVVTNYSALEFIKTSYDQLSNQIESLKNSILEQLNPVVNNELANKKDKQSVVEAIQLFNESMLGFGSTEESPNLLASNPLKCQDALAEIGQVFGADADSIIEEVSKYVNELITTQKQLEALEYIYKGIESSITANKETIMLSLESVVNSTEFAQTLSLPEHNAERKKYSDDRRRLESELEAEKGRVANLTNQLEAEKNKVPTEKSRVSRLGKSVAKEDTHSSTQKLSGLGAGLGSGLKKTEQSSINNEPVRSGLGVSKPATGGLGGLGGLGVSKPATGGLGGPNKVEQSSINNEPVRSGLGGLGVSKPATGGLGLRK